MCASSSDPSSFVKEVGFRWYGFTCDRIEPRFDFSFEEAHSAFSKQSDDNFDSDNDEFCDGLTTDEESLGRDLEGWIDFGGTGVEFGGIADDIASDDGCSLTLRLEALKNEGIDFSQLASLMRPFLWMWTSSSVD